MTKTAKENKIEYKAINRWMPPKEKDDEECNILELWARHYNDIDQARDDGTFYQYTHALELIEDALKDTPASCMNVYDILNAIQSNKTYSKGDKKDQPYMESSYAQRLSAIHAVYKYCEKISVCFDPISLSPFDRKYNKKLDLELTPAEISEEIDKEIKRLTSKKVCSLSYDVERKIVKKALSNLTGTPSERDGRWLGMLCYLYMGPRPSEGRGIRFRDFCRFEDHPNDWYCNLSHSSDSDGNIKAHGKNKNSVRRIPVHPELATILEKWMEYVKESYAEIDDLPVVCIKNNFNKPCSDIQLASFIKKQLEEQIFKEKETELYEISLLAYEEPDDDDGAPENNKDSSKEDFTTRIFRRNLITKLYSETILTDEEIRMIVGHKTSKRGTPKYALHDVYNWLLAMKHRMVMPELRNDWYTDVTDAIKEDQFLGGFHQINIAPNTNTRCVDIKLFGLEPGSNLAIEAINLPKEAKIEIEVTYLPSNYQTPHRVVSDNDHWYPPISNFDSSCVI